MPGLCHIIGLQMHKATLQIPFPTLVIECRCIIIIYFAFNGYVKHHCFLTHISEHGSSKSWTSWANSSFKPCETGGVHIYVYFYFIICSSIKSENLWLLQVDLLGDFVRLVDYMQLAKLVTRVTDAGLYFQCAIIFELLKNIFINNSCFCRGWFFWRDDFYQKASLPNKCTV